REKLEGLDALGAEAVEWMPDGSLFLRLTPSIWDIVRKETRTGVDQRRMSLVRRFTDALERRKDSRQRRDR
ncbi:MAG TPA: hypothetical protein VIF15_10455, partial [Polyangiaceae bacterium]